MNLSFSANFGSMAKPTVNGHTQPTVNGTDPPPSKFFDRLTSFPAVSSGIEAVKTNPITAGIDAVKSNPITGIPLDITKRTSLLFAAPAFPLASVAYFMLEPLIDPLVKKLDTVAHDSLDRIESTWPMISEEPGKIKDELKYLAFLPVTKSKEQKDYVSNTYSREYSKCGKGGMMSTGRAVICTQLIVLSDGLLWIKSMLSGGHEQQTTKVFKSGKLG
ncbi:MAG: hypothetical protein Q9224_003121 [Gallowayella concinna]